jgi:hypothetical protein
LLATWEVLVPGASLPGLGAARAIIELGCKLRENVELIARLAALETRLEMLLSGPNGSGHRARFSASPKGQTSDDQESGPTDGSLHRSSGCHSDQSNALAALIEAKVARQPLPKPADEPAVMLRLMDALKQSHRGSPKRTGSQPVPKLASHGGARRWPEASAQGEKPGNPLDPLATVEMQR